MGGHTFRRQNGALWWLPPIQPLVGHVLEPVTSCFAKGIIIIIMIIIHLLGLAPARYLAAPDNGA
jgi:hypothetical protein